MVRFPFGAAESWDPCDMHPVNQPDGLLVTDRDARAGLIWPAHDAWARLDALLYWDTGDYTEVRSRFVRDPLGLTGPPDSTCTEDHLATPGGQYRAKSWAIFVHPDTPIGLMVRHNSARPVRLALAEFKLSYHRCVEVPS
jgi:hypothetical protein